jgi:iron-sulfur cluster repair protein YtfE (RIC family)
MEIKEYLMSNQNSYAAVKKQYFKTLKQFVPIVERVHGSHHPEFYEVRKLFDAIVKEESALDSIFEKLQEVTDNYAIPEDVCESYEAVYKMLEALDHSYNESV